MSSPSAARMAALLHQAALQPAQSSPKPYSWTHSARSSLSPPHVPLSKRRRAPAGPLQASGTGSGSGIDTPATDSTTSSTTRASSSKKTSRKDKQRQQQLLRAREEQKQQQMLRASLLEDGGGEDDKDDELPQAVFDRILRRILFTVGAPMASGVALLNVYDALKRGQGLVVPSWLPLLTLLVSFGTSALGIAYGTLSASWDPEKEGSLLGLDEARTNWPELWKEEIDKAEKK